MDSIQRVEKRRRRQKPIDPSFLWTKVKKNPEGTTLHSVVGRSAEVVGHLVLLSTVRIVVVITALTRNTHTYTHTQTLTRTNRQRETERERTQGQTRQ